MGRTRKTEEERTETKKTTRKLVKQQTPLSLAVTPVGEDALVSYYSDRGAKSGRATPDEILALRNTYILSLMTVSGLSAFGCAREVSTKLGVSINGAKLWVKEALDTLVVVKSPEEREKKAALINDRLEEIYSKAMEKNNLKTAIAALESQAKLMGLYQQDIGTVNTQVVYQFKFGE